MSGLGGGKSGQQLRNELQAAADKQPCTTRCALCGWTYTGTAYEGRELAKGHRRAHHPDLRAKKRPRAPGRISRLTTSADHQTAGQRNAREVAEMIARRENAA